MPNWVSNRLKFEGDESYIKELITTVKTHYPRKPMESDGKTVYENSETKRFGWLDKETGQFKKRSGISDASEFGFDFCDGVPKDGLWSLKYTEAHDKFDFNKIVPSPKCLYTGNLSKEDGIKYKGRNWMDWNRKNWGTKWGAHQSKFLEDCIEFETAWMPPAPVILKLSELFPDVRIDHEYICEGYCVCGSDIYSDGQQTFNGRITGENAVSLPGLFARLRVSLLHEDEEEDEDE